MEFTNMNRLFQTAGQQKQQQGTGFTNLNRLFQANKDNQLGQKVTGNIQTQVGNVQSQIEQQKQKFQNEAEQSKLDTQQNREQREAVLGRFGQSGVAGQGPTEDEIKTFTKYRTGDYAGPQGLGSSDVAAMSGVAKGISGQVSNLSPSGTQELLRRTMAGNRYTQGQQRLDSLLMDRSGLRGVQRQAQGLTGDINRAQVAAQGQAQLIANQNRQFAEETKQALQSGASGIDQQVQAELEAAQAAEQSRLQRIQAVQDFAAGKVAKKDEAGNVVKDQYGNIVYDTVNPRGSTDKFEQMNNLANLLRQQGASEEEVTKLVGAGDFKTGQTQMEKNIDQAKLNRILDMYVGWNGQYTPGLKEAFLNIGKGLGVAAPVDIHASSGDSEGRGSVSAWQAAQNYSRYVTDLRNAITNSNIKTSDLLGTKYSETYGGTEIQTTSNYTLDQNTLNSYLGRTDLAGYGSDQRAIEAAKQQFYGTRGVLGEALQSGTDLEQVYGNLARSLASSQAAQNLTKQGVASDVARANYTALEALMGRTPDARTYRENDPRYEAGKFLINPDLIRSTI